MIDCSKFMFLGKVFVCVFVLGSFFLHTLGTIKESFIDVLHSLSMCLVIIVVGFVATCCY